MKKTHLLLFLFIFLDVDGSFAQSRAGAPKVMRLGTELKVVASLPRILKEASGLEVTRSGLLWTHNDDRYPILYGLDSSGKTRKTVHLNHPNKGWEDLAQDDNGNIYIGGFGNNKNDRRSLAIYKIPNPDSILEKVFTAEKIEYTYSDQRAYPPATEKMNFDMDAFISHGDSLYLFSKNRTEPFTGFTRIYRLPQEAGSYQAELYDSLYLGDGPMMNHWVTSADISPDGKSLALLSHNAIWLVTDFENDRFSSGVVYKVELGTFTHKTGLCFISDTEVYLLDELELGFIGGQIYYLDLARVMDTIHLQNKRLGSLDPPR